MENMDIDDNDNDNLYRPVSGHKGTMDYNMEMRKQVLLGHHYPGEEHQMGHRHNFYKMPKIQNEKGVKGIINMGNNCYLNSCLQILAHTKEMKNIMNDINKLMKYIHKQKTNETYIEDRATKLKLKLLLEFYYIMVELHDDTETNNINPLDFLNIFKQNKPDFIIEEQNDISEFLVILLEIIHDILKCSINIAIVGQIKNQTDLIAFDCFKLIKNLYQKEYSIIYSLFYGIHVSQIKKLPANTRLSRIDINDIDDDDNIETTNIMINYSATNKNLQDDIKIKNPKKDKRILSNKPDLFFILDLPINFYRFEIGGRRPHTENTQGGTMDFNLTQRNITLYDCLDEYTKKEIMENDNGWFNEQTNQKENVSKQILFWNFPTILIINLQRANTDGKYRKLIQFPIDDLDLSKYVIGYQKETYKYELYGICNHFGSSTISGHYTAFVKHSTLGRWIHYNDTIGTFVDESQIITPNASCLFYRRIHT